MKIQYLAVIFIIIILPISIVCSQYISSRIELKKIEMGYDENLSSATYDAVKAFQLNTVNNAISDRATSKTDNLQAVVNAFFNSLVVNFGYLGNDTQMMQKYVPAVVFSLYDGYYIYSPYVNTLTGLDNSDDDNKQYDENYSRDGAIREGLKNYIYYNCRYKINNSNDFVITYTLDNYITIDGYIKGKYVYDSGYLMTGITGSPSSGYTYDGITFRSNDRENMKEVIKTGDTETIERSYVKIDGTKFYLNDGPGESQDKIIYYDGLGNEHVVASKGENVTSSDGVEHFNVGGEIFALYENAITTNKSPYVYLKNAKEFTERVLGDGPNDYNLGNLKPSQGEIIGINDEGIDGTQLFSNDNPIFEISSGTQIQDSNSNFNLHRAEVIRRIIETNLTQAISGFKQYTSSTEEYLMPKISESDWGKLENNVCVTTFLQGMRIGQNKYNNYCVIPNTLNKEYVDEDDIYILKSSTTTIPEDKGIYCAANDRTLITEGGIIDKSATGYYAGISKLNFQKMLNGKNKYYYPMKGFYGSYTSIVGSSGINSIAYSDMYQYMRNLSETSRPEYVGKGSNITALKRAYYAGLARERLGVYNVNNGLNYEDQNTEIPITRKYEYAGEGTGGSNRVEVRTANQSIENWFYLKNYYSGDAYRNYDEDGDGNVEGNITYNDGET